MKIKTILLTIAGCTLSASVVAGNNTDYNSGNVTVTTGLGILGGESNEYVYQPENGQKVSELKWKIKNTPIIKGDISWDALNWLTLNARGWTSVASAHSGMDDYDWLTDGQSGWSHWSTHPNTRLNHANEFDINVKGWLLNQPTYRLGAMLGYQQTRFSWTAFGGRYNYNNGADIGEFPRNQQVIGYKQQFSTPYIGFVGRYRYQKFEFNGLLKFSRWVSAKDNDEHYLRNLTFREKTNNSGYYSATVDGGYYITPAAKIYTEVSASKYKEGRGGTKIINNTNGQSHYIGGDAAGIANMHYSVSVGLQYRF